MTEYFFNFDSKEAEGSLEDMLKQLIPLNPIRAKEYLEEVKTTFSKYSYYSRLIDVHISLNKLGDYKLNKCQFK